ncbi:hypothetical protein GGD81_002085 [Rhodobium orientis]|uniref:Helicase HerA central domain-containing protein n=1 Tax=Rhodobium orientis TaxID=34017 RepID=A0A327JTK5_9HYPH|nr:DUF87 domain-containing protein [Rhodobium orientis]MBB4303047.1 hypothetical protein [Rhodobium orientis]MBK5949605.1 hypothetical protein [Rhodobium orientis]RAI29391.1 hypothetical protein CH339_03665 [Rhodobium orientis]
MTQPSPVTFTQRVQQPGPGAQPGQQPSPERREPIGTIVSVSGSRGTIALEDPVGEGPIQGKNRISVGKLLKIDTDRGEVIGVVASMSAVSAPENANTIIKRLVEVDLVGEIIINGSQRAQFKRGVSSYPTIGDAVCHIDASELEATYGRGTASGICIGTLQQDNSVRAIVDGHNLLAKHFAILGATGVGKSCGVALVLQEVLQNVGGMRIFLIDPHNEYSNCFGNNAEVINPNNVNLPFWLFNFEEIVDVFFKARPGVEEEIEVLSELIPLAKKRFAAGRANHTNSLRKDDPSINFTADTPVPYRISDLMALLNARIGSLENKSHIQKYLRLKTRIETIALDPRYAFMFGNLTVDDQMANVLGRLFRIPTNGKPMTIMEVAGFPAEVVDALVSVLCRMAFDLGVWSDGGVPILVVCEEAHRYVPGNPNAGFGPTKRAISRIAKEGRKYGVFLGVVSQRPSELDPTILSQCNTLIAMRMANERDQAIVRSAIADTASGLIEFLPSLGGREAVAFGDAVALPMRMTFSELSPERMPHSSMHLKQAPAIDRPGADGRGMLEGIVTKWRSVTTFTRGDDHAQTVQAAANAMGDVPSTKGGVLRKTPEERPRINIRKPGSEQRLMEDGAGPSIRKF